MANRDKADILIHDYAELDHPQLARMWEKRQRGYRAMGYRAEISLAQSIPLPDTQGTLIDLIKLNFRSVLMTRMAEFDADYAAKCWLLGARPSAAKNRLGGSIFYNASSKSKRAVL